MIIIDHLCHNGIQISHSRNITSLATEHTSFIRAITRLSTCNTLSTERKYTLFGHEELSEGFAIGFKVTHGKKCIESRRT
jgi:hypothetical protein